MNFIFAVLIVSNGLCFVLTATADWASKNAKRGLLICNEFNAIV